MVELIIIFILLIALLIIGYFVFNIKITEIKNIGHDEKLDELASKFPDNITICKEVLKMLNNTKTKIKEDNSEEEISSQNNENKKKGTTSLYIAISDTILIGNIKDTYTRIQTICHECLHSIQPKRLLLFNFIYSNIYILYFIISIVLTLTNVLKNTYFQIIILTIMGFLQYAVRSYLENDAMIKARYIAKEYMLKHIEEEPICKKEEVEEIVKHFDKINLLGIPAYNYLLMFQVLRKILIYTVIVIFKNMI